MFSRGAISFGSFYADPYFIQGPALNTAVALEKEKAVWPCVVLDAASVALAEQGLIDHEGAGADADWRRALMRDETGKVFVNYLDAIELFLDEEDRVRQELAAHRDQIRLNLARDFSRSIREKYRRLAGYHDAFLSGLDQRYVADLYVESKDQLGSFEPFGADIPVREPEEIAYDRDGPGSSTEG